MPKPCLKAMIVKTTPAPIELSVSADVITARAVARVMAAAAGLGLMDQTRLATAVSELCRNALTHACGGTCVLLDTSDALMVRLEAAVSDHGPGIADLPWAMVDGHSTVGSLGKGLPGTRQLVDVFDIQSTPSGTSIKIAVVRRRKLLA